MAGIQLKLNYDAYVFINEDKNKNQICNASKLLKGIFMDQNPFQNWLHFAKAIYHVRFHTVKPRTKLQLTPLKKFFISYYHQLRRETSNFRNE